MFTLESRLLYYCNLFGENANSLWGEKHLLNIRGSEGTEEQKKNHNLYLLSLFNKWEQESFFFRQETAGLHMSRLSGGVNNTVTLYESQLSAICQGAWPNHLTASVMNHCLYQIICGEDSALPAAVTARARVWGVRAALTATTTGRDSHVCALQLQALT